MEFVTIEYENPDTHELFTQQIALSEDEADEIYSQMYRYDGNEIPVDSPVFNLLTAIRYISKLQGFKKTPNFNIIPPDNREIYQHKFIGEM